jgi:hypothetical protein
MVVALRECSGTALPDVYRPATTPEESAHVDAFTGTTSSSSGPVLASYPRPRMLDNLLCSWCGYPVPSPVGVTPRDVGADVVPRWLPTPASRSAGVLTSERRTGRQRTRARRHWRGIPAARASRQQLAGRSPSGSRTRDATAPTRRAQRHAVDARWTSRSLERRAGPVWRAGDRGRRREHRAASSAPAPQPRPAATWRQRRAPTAPAWFRRSQRSWRLSLRRS